MEKQSSYVYSKLVKEQLQLAKTRNILENMLKSINDNLNTALVEQLQLASSQVSSSSVVVEDVAETPVKQMDQVDEDDHVREVKDIIHETLNLEIKSGHQLDEEDEESD